MAAPEELGRALLAQGDHLTLEAITWRSGDGQTRRWEAAGRVGARKAAMIIALLQPSNRLVLIRQYRPPAGCAVIEFPAGLIDPGEAPEETARREFKEETGYTGTIARVARPAYNTPGLTGEAVYPVCMVVDEEAPANRAATPEPDEGEEIEVLRIPLDSLGAFWTDESQAGTAFDSKVVAFFIARGAAGAFA